MNFNEYKNAEFWQGERNRKAGQINLQQLVGIMLCGALTIIGLYSCATLGL